MLIDSRIRKKKKIRGNKRKKKRNKDGEISIFAKTLPSRLKHDWKSSSKYSCWLNESWILCYRASTKDFDRVTKPFSDRKE